MKATFLRPALAVLACAAALALASPSMAAVVKMKADLRSLKKPLSNILVKPATSQLSPGFFATFGTLIR